MTILTEVFFTIFNVIAEVVENPSFASGMAYIAAGICCLAPAASCIAEGLTAMKAVESIGRQPDASGKITTTMIIGQAVTETGALYGFIMAIMLLSK